jgi:hypothetical protein
MKKHLFDRMDHAPIGLEEFYELARAEVDIQDPQSLNALALPLLRLAQDETLLLKFVNRGLADWQKPERFHFYSPQSCQIISDGIVAVRANLWPLLPSDPRRRAILADALSYFDYHDHNFSFITANIFGPGYETEMYRYDPARMVGYVGEKVALEYLGRHCLDDRAVLFYEECSDVHVQLPPARLSASLNLMLVKPDSALMNQHYFDIEKGEISGYVGATSDKRVNALHFARHFHDDETADLLVQILETHPCSRTRVEAGRIVATIKGEAAISAQSKQRMLKDELARMLWVRRTGECAGVTTGGR